MELESFFQGELIVFKSFSKLIDGSRYRFSSLKGRSWFFIVSIFVLVCASSSLYADMVADVSDVEVNFEKDMKNFRHTFKLKNDGVIIEEIADIRAECGCTTSEMKKRKLHPGEEADLTVSIDLNKGDRSSRKSVLVVTESGKTLVLSIGPTIARAPKYIKIYPRYVYWHLQQGDNEAKKIYIEKAGEKDIESLDVVSGGDFVVNISELERGAKYQITISPVPDRTLTALKDQVEIWYRVSGVADANRVNIIAHIR